MEKSFNSSEISEINKILARDSQYAVFCQLETREEELPVMAVTALITDPVSLSDLSRSGPSKELSKIMVASLAILLISAGSN